LSEAIVLRKSQIDDGRATVPPAACFTYPKPKAMRSPSSEIPFLILGETRLSGGSRHIQAGSKGSRQKEGKKAPVEDSGYRLWLIMLPDHYEKTLR